MNITTGLVEKCKTPSIFNNTISFNHRIDPTLLTFKTFNMANVSETSLAEKSIISGGDHKPPMLDSDLYDSWKNRIEFYMMNHPNGRMVLRSLR